MRKEHTRYEKVSQYLERKRTLPVQAFINSIAFPKTLDDVLYFMKEAGRFDAEILFEEDQTEWSVPRWCKKGDIVLFMHTVTSIKAIKHLNNIIKTEKQNYSDSDYKYIVEGLKRGEEIYNNIGGKIFAIGVVSGNIEKYPGEYWNFAEISHIMPLKRPIAYSEFKETQKLSTAGSITPVYSWRYGYILDLISRDTELPGFIRRSRSEPIREANINRENWLLVAKDYRFRYTLESQFRAGFVDYLLKEISDTHRLYEECHTKKANGDTGFVDNIIPFNGFYLPVEVKLDIRLEADLSGQVRKYCHLSDLVLNSKSGKKAPLDEVYPDRVLIIDTFRIYMYYYEDNTYLEIFDLWDLEDHSDIVLLRKTIENCIKTMPATDYNEYDNMTLSYDYQDSGSEVPLQDSISGFRLSMDTRDMNYIYRRREERELDRYVVNDPDVDMAKEFLNRNYRDDL